MSQNYDLAEAAKYLRCRPHFLEDNLKELPHQRMGRSISFDERDLEEIKDMFRIRPGRTQVSGTSVPLALATLRPSKRSQKVS
ncbi:hypothetical protein [Streptomyces sp. NPDC048438]|uniref:hypothetical protein n=1 Tax=Streptomyces sp. NPDC048438 TaxID=3365551 RepID=UPI00371B9D71